MTITESGIQPLLALVFIVGGALCYLPKILLGWLPMQKRLPVSRHLLEGVWGLFYTVAFGAVSHVAYDGRIKYFTMLSYLIGALLAALFLKLPMETLYRFLKKKAAQVRAKRASG